MHFLKFNSFLNKINHVRYTSRVPVLMSPSGIPGSGAGKGGGAGGSIRESGGGLGKFGAAQEEGYFYNKQQEQLKKMKQKLKNKKGELSQKDDK